MLKQKTTMKRCVGIALALVAALALFALPAGAASAPKPPTATYTSKVSNVVQTLILSNANESGDSQNQPTIYYTTNGKAPAIGSDYTKKYKKGIKIDNNMTVWYCAYQNGLMSTTKKIEFVYLKPVIIKEIYCTDGKTTKITMKWKRNYSADGYRVYRKKSGDSSWKKVKTVKDVSINKFVDSSVTKNAKYSYYVVAYKGDVVSKKTDVVQTIKAKHTHKYTLKSVSCSKGIRTYVCDYCGHEKQETFTKNTHEMTKSKSNYYTIEVCKWCGKTKKYLTKKIPSYWNTNIVSALNTAKNRDDLAGYVFVTDPHWQMNTQNSPEIVSYVTKQMGYPFAICGGDVIATYHNKKQDAIDEIESFYKKFSVPVLSVAGNHDYNSNSNTNESSYLSSSEIERLIYSHNPSTTYTKYNGDVSYCDDSTNKIRYLTFYYDETAAVPTKITDYLRDRVCELDSDWTVILFSHAYWHYKRPGEEPTPKGMGKDLAARLLTIQRNSEANIALWHVGHIHRDKYETLSDNNGTKLLVVASNCDTYSKSAPWGGLEMTAGTNKEQVVEIVQIDKDSHKIYMTRIGAGASRTFSYSPKSRNIAYSYSLGNAAAPKLQIQSDANLPVEPESDIDEDDVIVVDGNTEFADENTDAEASNDEDIEADAVNEDVPYADEDATYEDSSDYIATEAQPETVEAIQEAIQDEAEKEAEILAEMEAEAETIAADAVEAGLAPEENAETETPQTEDLAEMYIEQAEEQFESGGGWCDDFAESVGAEDNFEESDDSDEVEDDNIEEYDD